MQEGVKADLPGGVEEGVSCDAVSRCRWGNEPESWSAASIHLPLEAIVAVYVEWKQSKHLRQKHPAISALPLMTVLEGWGGAKTSHRWHLTFHASNLWRRRYAVHVCTNYNYTWAKSKGPFPLFIMTGRKNTASPVRAGRFHKAFGDKVLFYPTPLFLILWYQRDEGMKGTQRHSKFSFVFPTLTGYLFRKAIVYLQLHS